ncbi:hypothetical protein V2J09_004963 [Rumex salicifolius]
MIAQSLKSFSAGRVFATGTSQLRGFCTATSVIAEAVVADLEEDAPSAGGTSVDKEDSKKTMWHLYRQLSTIRATKGKVFSVLDGYVREGRLIGKKDLLSCVRKLRTYKRHQHCLDIFEWMDTDKIKYDYSHRDHALRLDLICKTKGITEAEQFFESLSSDDKNLYTYGALLNCYCTEKLRKKAAELFKIMEELNYVTGLTFNNLITLALTTGEPEKVPKLIEEMKSRNFPMNSYCYNLLIQSYEQQNDMEAVERTVEEIEKEEVSCQWSIYSNLAAIYVRNGDSEKAEMTLKKLEESSKNSESLNNPTPYHYLISLYARIGNLAEVNRIWESHKSNFRVISNVSYMVMLQALLKLGQHDELVKNFKDWESAHKHYDCRMASIVMASYLRQNEIEEAELTFNVAVEKSGTGFFKGREMLVSYLLDKRDTSRALEHLEEAADASKVTDIWKPSPEKILDFFKYFEEEKDVDGAEKLFKLMKNLKCLNSNSYLCLLRVYVAAEVTAPDMRQRMKEDGVEIEITSEHEILLEKVCPQESASAIMEHFTRLCSMETAMIAHSLKSFSIGRLFAAGSSQLRCFCTATSVHAESAVAEVEEDAPSSGGTSGVKEDSTRTMELLYRRLSATGATKVKVSNVLDGYVREGRLIEKNDLLKCARKLRGYKRYQDCLEIFEWMDKIKYNYSTKDHALRMDLICKTKGITVAEQFFESLSSDDKNLYTYGALLNCYCTVKLGDKATELFKEMEELNYVTGLTFNNLITLALATGEPEKVPKLIEEMKSRNFPMNSYSYSLLIQSYQLLNDMEAVERTVEEIEKEEVSCQWSIYSNLAAVYIRNGDSEKAEKSLKKLEESFKNSEDRNNPFPYHYLISFYAGIGNLAEVNRIWESLKSDLKITSNISYMVMLQALLKLGQHDELVKHFKEWESVCKLYDPRIVAIVMASYLRQNEIEEAEKAFKVASEKSGKGFFRGREVLVSYLLDKRDTSRALDHLEEAAGISKESEIWKPSPEKVHDFFKNLEEEKDVDGAEKLFKLLKKLKCLNSKSYLWLLRVYVSAEKTAPDMRQRMKEDGFEIKITSQHEALLEKLRPLPLKLTFSFPAFMITRSLKSLFTGRLYAAGTSQLRGFCSATEAETVVAAVEENAPSVGTSAGKEDSARTMWNLYRRLSAIGATRDKVADVLDGFVREGYVVRKNDLLFCVRKLRNYKRHPDCLEIFEWMDKNNYTDSQRDRAIRLDLICKIRGIAKAEKFFESLSAEDKNLYTYGALLNCYCIGKLSDKAAELVAEMEKQNFVSSLTFNNLMTLALTTGEPEKVPKIVEVMKRRNFPLCSYSYSLLIQSYQLLNDMEAAERTVQEIEKAGKNGHWSIYSNLAAAYIKAGNFEKAEMALKKLEGWMRKLRVPYPVPYHYLIGFYAEIGNLAEVNRIWESLRSDFKTISNISYITMIQALLKLGQQDDLVKYFKEWESGFKHYDTRMPIIVIAGYLKQNKIEEAEKVFNEAVEKSKRPFYKGREMLIAHFLDKRDINRALEHLEVAADAIKETDKWKPSTERIHDFFKYFEEKKDVDGAEKFFKLLKKLKCLKSKSYLWLLRAYVAAEQTAPDMRQRIKEDGFEDEISSEYEILLKKECPQ